MHPGRAEVGSQLKLKMSSTPPHAAGGGTRPDGVHSTGAMSLAPSLPPGAATPLTGNQSNGTAMSPAVAGATTLTEALVPGQEEPRGGGAGPHVEAKTAPVARFTGTLPPIPTIPFPEFSEVDDVVEWGKLCEEELTKAGLPGELIWKEHPAEDCALMSLSAFPELKLTYARSRTAALIAQLMKRVDEKHLSSDNVKEIKAATSLHAAFGIIKRATRDIDPAKLWNREQAFRLMLKKTTESPNEFDQRLRKEYEALKEHGSMITEETVAQVFARALMSDDLMLERSLMAHEGSGKRLEEGYYTASYAKRLHLWHKSYQITQAIERAAQAEQGVSTFMTNAHDVDDDGRSEGDGDNCDDEGDGTDDKVGLGRSSYGGGGSQWSGSDGDDGRPHGVSTF